ncbi:MAG: N-carbamoylputrescine amidase [Armatimonadetes bacterium]|nr:N-carbamoylputrescine amidase [Armatimonadota bacterium]
MRLALIQMAMEREMEPNVKRAVELVREAAARGGQVILLPELFAGWYFPQHQHDEDFGLAHPLDRHPFLPRLSELAAELQVVLPVSFFERAHQSYFNSLVLFDADGRNLGLYRKSHIPDGPGYQEKFFFNPGDTGFRVWDSRYGRLGVGVCWDQWFPEAARCMAVQGAELLLYPTAIGSEPPEAGELDTRAMWQRAMVGHAVCNSCYLGAANRVGREADARFYGTSFICDYRGEILTQGAGEETVLVAELDFEKARRFRAGMGFFRDRRPELYRPLLTLDGSQA